MSAPYLSHEIILGLAWFIIINAAACAAAVMAIAVLRRRDLPSTAWFWLRLAPAIASVVFVALVFLPSYWQYEPLDTGEGFDVTLTALAATSFALIGLAAVRAAYAWMSASHRARAWMKAARPLDVAGGIPMFAIDADAPMMALVGLVRPRLIVTTPLVAALSPDEMQASIAHEIAHWRAGDNLKRLAMRTAPDLMGLLGVGRLIERRWASAAEHAADHGAGESPATRCALASALVKIVRLMPQATPPAEPISTLVGGGDVAARVTRLLEDRPVAGSRTLPVWSWAAAIAIVLAIAAAYPASLVAIHEATETLVRSLP